MKEALLNRPVRRLRKWPENQDIVYQTKHGIHEPRLRKARLTRVLPLRALLVLPISSKYTGGPPLKLVAKRFRSLQDCLQVKPCYCMRSCMSSCCRYFDCHKVLMILIIYGECVFTVNCVISHFTSFARMFHYWELGEAWTCVWASCIRTE